MNRMFLIFLTLFLSCALSAAEKVTLVKDGIPQCAIILPERPTSTAQFAAMELQHHIKMISGAQVPIRKENEPCQGTKIYVGETLFAEKHGYRGKDFKPEESLIKFLPDGILLIGKDLPVYGTPVYGTFTNVPYFYNYNKGTLYAAYNFLERYLGVRWYAPTDLGTAYVPRKTIEAERKDLRQKPAMPAFRNAWMPKLWMERGKEFSKYDTELMKLRWRMAINYGYCNHNVYSIWYQYWGKAKDPEKAKFFIEKRPEYFAQGYQGKSSQHLVALHKQYPGDNDLPPQICNSNEDVIKHFAREAVGKYEGTAASGLGVHVAKMEGMPWFYPIEPDDNTGFCLCKNCLALFRNRRIDGKRPTNYIHFDWISRIAREAAKRNPNVNIVTLAYIESLSYPKGYDIAPNVGIQMCINPYDFWVNFDGSAKKYQEWIDNGETGKRMMTLWTYMFSGSWYAKYVDKNEFFFPMFAHTHTGDLFRKFVKDGIQGWFGETPDEVGMPFWHTQLESYIACKMADDPTLDSRKLIDEFFPLYYGAAAEPMRRFYDLVEKAAWEKSIYGKGTKAVNEEFNWGKIGTKERMNQLAETIAEAQKLVRTPQEKQRLAWFVDGIWKPMLKGRANYDKKQQFRTRPVTSETLKNVSGANGNPEKVDWNGVEFAKPMKTIAGFPGSPDVRIKMAQDDAWFYLMFTEKTETSKLKNNPEIWNGDELELFFAADTERPYMQYAVNPVGKSIAIGYYYKNMIAYSSPQKTEAVFRSIVTTDRWTLYAAIPRKEMFAGKNPGKGASFRANIFRGSPGSVALAWSPTYSNAFHDLSRMGILTPVP